MKYIPYFVLLTGILIATAGCDSDCDCEEDRLKNVEPVQVDLAQIKQRGTLKAITTYSSTSYFIYRGQPMGYEYELLERLANHLDVDLEMIVAEDLDSVMYLVNQGLGDLIAHGLTITKERKNYVDFTTPINTTKQVLVQRKPENWRQMKLHQIEKKLIRNPVDLIGDTVHVRKNSSYYRRIHNLSEELGDDIHIALVPGNISTEEILQKVANGEYKYTVADKNIAKINQTYNPILDVETDLSLPTRIAWAVRKTSPELKSEINQWLEDLQKDPVYYVLYNKYYENTRAFTTRIKSEFYSKAGGKISKYDDEIKEYATDLNWDWRLLASQIYQESKFNPGVTSWAGAKGLMQVMPATAQQFGVTELYDPSQSLKAGVKYIEFLQNYWTVIPDSTERIKFILASYNAGPAHVEDARRLAEKYGKDPNVWEANVAQYILLKSKPKYYNDEVVEYGYVRGKEPFNYVDEIIKRYRHYQKFIDADLDDMPEVAMNAN